MATKRVQSAGRFASVRDLQELFVQYPAAAFVWLSGPDSPSVDAHRIRLSTEDGEVIYEELHHACAVDIGL